MQNLKSHPETEVDTLDMTPQQQRFNASRKKGIQAYRDLVVGPGEGVSGWLELLGYELYTMVCTPMPGALGYAARSVTLPLMCKSWGGGTIVGKDVVIRHPKRISFGKGVVLDDFSSLDIRDREGQSESPYISLGDFCLVGKFSSIIAKGGTVSLGNACNISSHCRIATESSITIEESVLIAGYVYIGPGNHRRDEKTGRVLLAEEMDIRGGVHIGSGSWIGTKATILDGVKIGKNCIVGAHSLVREDVPDGAVVAGTPAKIISRVE